MKFYDGFLGEDDANQTVNFVGGDTKEMFEKNLRKMPNDWYYKDKCITYKFNEYGHRCKSIKDIDFDNYFLVVGCSHSQGVGLELEKTFPCLLSEYLQYDYYNLSISGSGIDVAEHNTLMWYSKFERKPKFLILQWPNLIRYVSYAIDINNIRPNGRWSLDENNLKFLTIADAKGLFLARKRLANELVNNVALSDTKIISLEYSSNTGYLKNSAYFNQADYARDLGHMGIESNKNITNSLISLIKSEIQ